MTLYSVRVPIVGYAYIEVEAENEHDAKEVAKDQITASEIEEWTVDINRADVASME
jgi:hypothetical protein